LIERAKVVLSPTAVVVFSNALSMNSVESVFRRVVARFWSWL